MSEIDDIVFAALEVMADEHRISFLSGHWLEENIRDQILGPDCWDKYDKSEVMEAARRLTRPLDTIQGIKDSAALDALSASEEVSIFLAARGRNKVWLADQLKTADGNPLHTNNVSVWWKGIKGRAPSSSVRRQIEEVTGVHSRKPWFPAWQVEDGRTEDTGEHHIIHAPDLESVLESYAKNTRKLPDLKAVFARDEYGFVRVRDRFARIVFEEEFNFFKVPGAQ